MPALSVLTTEPSCLPEVLGWARLLGLDSLEEEAGCKEVTDRAPRACTLGPFFPGVLSGLFLRLPRLSVVQTVSLLPVGMQGSSPGLCGGCYHRFCPDSHL